MKDWSKLWKASILPKKQRKYVYNLPAHLKGKLLSSHLSKELRKKYNTRNIRIRKGDNVKIMRGQHRGKTGKVERVDLTNITVYITGIEHTKRDGSKAHPPFKPSHLLIQELDTTDKRRFTPQTTEKTATPTETKK